VVFLSFLDGFRVESSKVKGKPLKNDVGESTRSFQDAIIVYIWKQDEIDFI
jgi:hypothetical protein